MAEFKIVAVKIDITTGSGKTIDVDGKRIALFNVDGNFYAIDDTCPHKGGPLGEGALEGDIVTCPWHGWQYDVKTGVNKMNPQIKVKLHEVKIEGEEILVSVG